MTDTPTTFELLADVPPVPKLSKATAADKTRIRGGEDGLAVLAPFERLLVGNDNIRDAAGDQSALRSLASSISAVGLLQPLPCTPYQDEAHPDGAWLLAAGHRRYLALVALGFTGSDLVPIHPIASADSTTRAQRMVAENFHRQDLTPIEEAELIDRLQRLHGMSQRDIAMHLGWNKSTVNKRLNLLELPDDAQAMVAAGTLPVEFGERLGKLLRGGMPPSRLAPLLRHHANGLLTSGLLDSTETKLAAGKAADTLVARLEARGVVVVVDPARAPVADGEEARRARVFELPTAAAVREFDLDGLDTIRRKDKTPVLLVEPTREGTAVAWSLKVTTPAPASRPPDAGRDWEAERAARTALQHIRLARAKDLPMPSDQVLFRTVAGSLLANAGSKTMRQVAEWMGLDPIDDDHGRLDVAACLDAWLDRKATKAVKAILWATVCADEATAMIDGRAEPPWLLPTRVLLDAGMLLFLSEEAFGAAVERARENLDRQADTGEEA